MISTWSYIIDGKKCFTQLQAIRTYNNKALHEQNLFKKIFFNFVRVHANNAASKQDFGHQLLD